MSFDMNTEVPSTSKDSKKRPRDKPNKRWADEEIRNILQYIRSNQDFEKPTARMYYTNMMQTVKVDATWDIIKWKVRHLKANYNKAEDWRKNTGSGLLDTDEGTLSIKEKLHQICKYYTELHDVFGQKNLDFPFITYESTSASNNILNSTEIYDDSVDIQDEFEGFEALEEIEYEELALETNLLPTSQSAKQNSSTSNKEQVRSFTKKMKKSAPKTAIGKLTDLQSEKTEYLKSKIGFEKEKFEKEFDLNERKFLEVVQKRKDEIELRKLEIEKDERLKKMKIEAKERIKKYKIEMKYKKNSQN